jgi:alpha-mannosidase
MIGGEEVLPNRCILTAMEKVNKEFTGKINFRFGDISEYWEINEPYYKSVESGYKDPTVDLNPVHQGCYVTRIENKQRTRALTYALLNAESSIAAVCWKTGKLAVPPEEFTRAWQNLLLNMHHDSISGAHIDAGQIELMDYLDECEAMIGKYISVKKEYIANRIGIDKSKAGICEKILGKMKIRYNIEGIISVVKNGKDLFGSFNYKNMTYTRNSSDTIHIGELLLQCDWGDNHNAYLLGDYVLLGKYNYSVYEGNDYIWWRGKHEAIDPSVKKLQWEIRIQLSRDGERIDFVTEVNWDTSNKRIRAVFPVNDIDSRKAVWEIPYGFIERTYNPETVPPFGLDTLATRSIGEYPSLHWVRHDITNNTGIAILNKGIPSAKWIPGCFEISLLRSPTMTGDTVLPSVDEIWDVDDTRDTGKHLFEYSVWPFTEYLPYGDLTRAGYAYNKASPELPFPVEGDVVVTTFKLAENGSGFILRIQEAGGKNSKVALTFDKEKRVTPVNLMENTYGTSFKGEKYVYELHKHEILTLLIQTDS